MDLMQHTTKWNIEDINHRRKYSSDNVTLVTLLVVIVFILLSFEGAGVKHTSLSQLCIFFTNNNSSQKTHSDSTSTVKST